LSPAHAGLKLTIFQPQPPECWIYKHAPPTQLKLHFLTVTVWFYLLLEDLQVYYFIPL
jgi:hypothetical protein